MKFDNYKLPVITAEWFGPIKTFETIPLSEGTTFGVLG